MKPRATCEAQRRAVKAQQTARVESPYVEVRWFCGGCGTTIVLPSQLRTDSRALALCATLGGQADVLALAECPEPLCDARVVRCAACGGGPAARAALARHVCRAVAT